jgi:phage terminase small subunit
MTEQVKRFADRFFETLKGKESAIYAGYSEHTAAVQASQMLATQEVEDYLSVLRTELSEKTGITQTRVLQEIGRLAFSDIRKYYTGDDQLRPITDLDDDEAAALSSVKSYEEIEPRSGAVLGVNKEIKIYDKLAALEKLARHLGMYEKDNNSKIGITLHFDSQDEQVGSDVQKD